ncbi:hypothetical protein EJ04DRAFT_574090 [Polyplosphaeria fusca]|uniref:Uncharacterized protein n=1 Tax=Polyplosphaeria fusca TaxID=682080 RepID=A0A9P4R6U3_9PLEO|nr:hypothetical protein EJ04DRAFT_574090 [Polyplosphaeria fusca]
MGGRVNELIEALGLRTFGAELHDPAVVVKRPKFLHDDVIQLFKKEIPALFGTLVKNEGATLDRNNLNLFDKELDDLLAVFGPKIWPELGHGDRTHLRQPSSDSHYKTPLVYPKDRDLLKKHIRNIILSKKSRPDTDATKIDALISKQGERRSTAKKKKKAPVTSKPAKPLPVSEVTTPKSTISSLKRRVAEIELAPLPDSEDPEVGHRKQQKMWQKPPQRKLDIELRLFRTSLSTTGKDFEQRSLFLDKFCTSDECFTLICQQMEVDCSWLVFHLPEDMSPDAQIRITRGIKQSEYDFRKVLDIFSAAPAFPEGACRACEVEFGLDD